MDWKNKLPQIQNRLRFQLFSRKYDGIHQVFPIFYEADADRSQTLNKYEFESFLSKVGMFVSTQEMSELFKFYDKNNDGQIDVSEFLAALQGQLSDRRLEIVKQAWQFLDARGQGRLQKSEILQKFNAAAHPRVPTREKTVEEVKQEFQAALNQYGSGNFITEDDFCSLYLSYNGTIPIEQDTYFTSLLVNVWGLNAQQDFIANERVAELEDILYEKVRQRCKGNDDEGKTMTKVFRYFDTDNTGAISLGEFNRALEQFGCTFNANETRALFQKYDADNSGQIDYEEFVKVFARKGAAGPNQFGETREPPNAVLDKIIKELLRRGAHGIRGLGIVFRRMDNNRDRHLDRYEFEWGLRENGHRLSALDMERLFKYFDRSKDGKISYDEFLRAIRGDLNERRRNLVLQAYRKLDKNKDGKVNIEDMRIAYDVSFHPNFKSGAQSADDILKEFMSQWDTIDRDGNVTGDEFIDYYKDVSASIDRDDEFELMIRNAWHLEGGEGWCENTTIPRHLQVDADGTERVVMAKGSENFSYDKNAKRFWGADI